MKPNNKATLLVHDHGSFALKDWQLEDYQSVLRMKGSEGIKDSSRLLSTVVLFCAGVYNMQQRCGS